MQGLTGLSDSQRARLDGLRVTHNKLRARQGLAPLSLAEFADHYRAESAARGASSTFLDVDESRSAPSSSTPAAFDSADAFAQLNAPYFDRFNGAQSMPQSAPTQASSAPRDELALSSSTHVPAVAAGDLFAKLNERYEQATARARVGGTGEAAVIGDDA